jgi:hypothetical protein
MEEAHDGTTCGTAMVDFIREYSYDLAGNRTNKIPAWSGGVDADIDYGRLANSNQYAQIPPAYTNTSVAFAKWLLRVLKGRLSRTPPT